MPRKPPKGKSLAELNPELAKQWHTSKNGDLTPYDVAPFAHKKVWWKCDKGDDHEWESSISGGIGCPICSSYMVVGSNCLAHIFIKIKLLRINLRHFNLRKRDLRFLELDNNLKKIN
tara:strand:+ start:55 stop:405 length:351 start_codon:yes stop_codon:yes gene_type:complete